MIFLKKLEEEFLVGFGEVIDRLVSTHSGTVPIIRKGRGGKTLNRYSWMKVYDDTRKRIGRPLTLLAAEKIIKEVKISKSSVIKLIYSIFYLL